MEAKREWVSVWAICILGGLAVGISGFSSESNHPTYLTPALHYIDPSFLAHDWWLTSSAHYHFAYFGLAVVLAKLGALEVGLALLNVLVVACGIHACFRIMSWLRAEAVLACLTIFVVTLLATQAYVSAGGSYLYTASLQPSSIAATATVMAIAGFLEGQYKRCGLWLGLAGLFHVNFLITNIPLFGVAYVFSTARSRPIPSLLDRQFAGGLIRIVWPSLLVAALFLPLIISVANATLPPTQQAMADWVFFRFAVPFHYFPPDFADQLISLAAWQILGILWTMKAIPNRSQRRPIWAIQISFALIIWLATALTTIVFIPSVSRLYLWRLAPFSMMLSSILIIVGAARLVCSSRKERRARHDMVLLVGSLVGLAYITVFGEKLRGQLLDTAQIPPVAFVFLSLFAAVGLSWWTGPIRIRSRYLGAAILSLAFCFGVAVQPTDGKGSRYSLLLTTSDERDQQELFEFVRRSTGADAQFLVPPELNKFRLETGRAIIVDFKGLPINKSGTIEWYRRLEDISGVQNPKDRYVVSLKFRSLDARRLEFLRGRYGVDYAVLPVGVSLSAEGWSEVFRNRSYRVLVSDAATESHYAGAAIGPRASRRPKALAGASIKR